MQTCTHQIILVLIFFFFAVHTTYSRSLHTIHYVQHATLPCTSIIISCRERATCGVPLFNEYFQLRVRRFSCSVYNTVMYTSIKAFSKATLNMCVTLYSWIYFPWPLRKQAACKQATREPIVFKSFPRDWAMRIKCLAQGHYCRCQQIRTGDLMKESQCSYLLSHNSSLLF